MLADRRSLLSNVILQPNVSEILQWHPDLAGGYSVRLGYEILSTQDHHVLDAEEKLIWHTQVSLKVSILVWRCLRDRLLTKINLHNRGIISDADTSCVAGCQQWRSNSLLCLDIG